MPLKPLTVAGFAGKSPFSASVVKKMHRKTGGLPGKINVRPVFKIDIHDIRADTSADDIDQWTSIEHVDFLVILQKEFDIEFTDSQIVEMLSYKAVVQNVKAAIAGENN